MDSESFITGFRNNPRKRKQLISTMVNNSRRIFLNFPVYGDARKLAASLKDGPYSDYFEFEKQLARYLHPILAKLNLNVISDILVNRQFETAYGSYAGDAEKVILKSRKLSLPALKDIILRMIDRDGHYMVVKFYDLIVRNRDAALFRAAKPIELGIITMKRSLAEDEQANIEMVKRVFARYINKEGGRNAALMLERIEWDDILRKYLPHLTAAMEQSEGFQMGDATSAGIASPLASSLSDEIDEIVEETEPAEKKRFDQKKIEAYAAVVKKGFLDKKDDNDGAGIKKIIDDLLAKNRKNLGEDGSREMVDAVLKVWLEDDAISEIKKRALSGMVDETSPIQYPDEQQYIHDDIQPQDEKESAGGVMRLSSDDLSLMDEGIHDMTDLIEGDAANAFAGEEGTAHHEYDPPYDDQSDLIGSSDVMNDEFSAEIEGGKGYDEPEKLMAGDEDLFDEFDDKDLSDEELAPGDTIRVADEDPDFFRIKDPENGELPVKDRDFVDDVPDLGEFSIEEAGGDSARYADKEMADTLHKDGGFLIEEPSGDEVGNAQGRVHDDSGKLGNFLIEDAHDGELPGVDRTLIDETLDLGEFDISEHDPGEDAVVGGSLRKEVETDGGFLIEDPAEMEAGNADRSLRDDSVELGRFLVEDAPDGEHSDGGNVLRDNEVDELGKFDISETAGTENMRTGKEMGITEGNDDDFIIDGNGKTMDVPDGMISSDMPVELEGADLREIVPGADAENLSLDDLSPADDFDALYHGSDADRAADTEIDDEAMTDIEGNSPDVGDIIDERDQALLDMLGRSAEEPPTEEIAAALAKKAGFTGNRQRDMMQVLASDSFQDAFNYINKSGRFEPREKIILLEKWLKVVGEKRGWFKNDRDRKMSKINRMIEYYMNILTSGNKRKRAAGELNEDNLVQTTEVELTAKKGDDDAEKDDEGLPPEERVYRRLISVIRAFADTVESMEPILMKIITRVDKRYHGEINARILMMKRQKDKLVKKTIDMVRDRTPDPGLIDELGNASSMQQYIWGASVSEKMGYKKLEDIMKIFDGDKDFYRDISRIIKIININNKNDLLKNMLSAERKILSEVEKSLTRNGLKKIWTGIANRHNKDRVKLLRDLIELTGDIGSTDPDSRPEAIVMDTAPAVDMGGDDMATNMEAYAEKSQRQGPSGERKKSHEVARIAKEVEDFQNYYRVDKYRKLAEKRVPTLNNFFKNLAIGEDNAVAYVKEHPRDFISFLRFIIGDFPELKNSFDTAQAVQFCKERGIL